MKSWLCLCDHFTRCENLCECCCRRCPRLCMRTCIVRVCCSRVWLALHVVSAWLLDSVIEVESKKMKNASSANDQFKRGKPNRTTENYLLSRVYVPFRPFSFCAHCRFVEMLMYFVTFLLLVVLCSCLISLLLFLFISLCVFLSL